MPSRGQSITVTYTAWDTVNNVPKTGDVANHTLRWVKDGTSAAPTNSPAEVDSTNAPGEYNLVLTSSECTCNFGKLCGKSSTSGIVIIPVAVSFEQLPTALQSGRVDASVGAYQAGLAPPTSVALSSSGLDAVQVETGVNARQALSAVLSACAGVLSGSGTDTVTIYAGANPATQRIQATIDGSKNRTAVTLNLPS